MSSVLQPLDAVLNKPFKDRLHELYNEWVMSNNSRTLPWPAATTAAFNSLRLGVVAIEVASWGPSVFWANKRHKTRILFGWLCCLTQDHGDKVPSLLVCLLTSAEDADTSAFTAFRDNGKLLYQSKELLSFTEALKDSFTLRFSWNKLHRESITEVMHSLPNLSLADRRVKDSFISPQPRLP